MGNRQSSAAAAGAAGTSGNKRRSKASSRKDEGSNGSIDTAAATTVVSLPVPGTTAGEAAMGPSSTSTTTTLVPRIAAPDLPPEATPLPLGRIYESRPMGGGSGDRHTSSSSSSSSDTTDEGGDSPDRDFSLLNVSGSTSSAALRVSSSGGLGLGNFPMGNAVLAYSNTSLSRRYNSTQTVFVDSTISSMSLDPLLNAFAAQLLAEMDKDMAEAAAALSGALQLAVPAPPTLSSMELLDERKYPLSRDPLDFSRRPSVETIVEFLKYLFANLQLTSEAALITLVYIERLRNTRNKRDASESVPLLPHSWRRITLAAVVTAAKVWDDAAVWNADVVDQRGQINITGADVNRLERAFLRLLGYHVNVKPNAYTRAYFTLREFAILHDIGLHATQEEIERAAQAAAVNSKLRANGLKAQHEAAATPIGSPSESFLKMAGSSTNIVERTRRFQSVDSVIRRSPSDVLA